MSYTMVAATGTEAGTLLAKLQVAEVALVYLSAARSMKIGVTVWNDGFEIDEDGLKRHAALDRANIHMSS
jgi:hypothetical protein